MIRAFEQTIPLGAGLELTVLTYAAGHGPTGQVQLIQCDLSSLDTSLILATRQQARDIARALLTAADLAELQELRAAQPPLSPATSFTATHNAA